MVLRTTCRLTAVLAILVACSTASEAQMFRPRKGPKRFEICYNYQWTNTNLTYQERSFNEANGLYLDSNSTMKVKSTSGFGYSFNYGIPLAKMGHRSRLVSTIGFTYNASLFNGYTSFAYTETAGFGSATYGDGTIQMGVPITVELKYGGEAYLDKSDRFLASIGVGATPSIYFSGYDGTSGKKASVMPCLKAEVGVFAGIAFKLRLIQSFGNVNLINIDTRTDNGGGLLRWSARSTTQLGLVIMPFSWMWSKNEWWN